MTRIEPVTARCANCEAALQPGQSYCSACGQATHLGRLTLHEIGHEAMHALVHVDRSVLALLRDLVIRPGIVALDYVQGKRRQHFGPFAFLVVVVALATALVALTGFSVVSASVPNRVADFLQHHVNLVFFLQVPMTALACRAVAFNRRFNVAEYLVLAAYTSGLHMLVYALLVVPGWFLLRSRPGLAATLYDIYMPFWPLYFGYACAQFHAPARWRWFAKGAAVVGLVFLLTQLLADRLARLFG
jgi:hypothetical protein